ncbi:MAG: PEP-CTERM sorting domain-containing protein [Methylacidiphilales bacterium]|nr:PEP-CTERM sorting domain-containing protein [Candidatus Methylacidiphilales bacterium]NJR17197.1 PEP-CTERM sorting domain-containing protein [Calothrix sp. CSU_2_0]
MVVTPPTTSVPEPASIFGLLAVSAFGVNSIAKRKYKTIRG